MIKSDEIALMDLLRERRPTPDHEFVHVRKLAEELGIQTKRAEYITLKWENRGWYEYGVHCLAGWLTDAGYAVDLRAIDASRKVES